MSKKKKVVYKGFFLDADSSTRIDYFESDRKLEKDISDKHVTFEVYPSIPFPDELLGKSYTLEVVGYGNDGENSGFEVLLPEELYPYYQNPKRPHLTTSVSLTGEPKNTAYLHFKPITPFKVTGVLGYYYGKSFAFNNKELDGVSWSIAISN